MAEEQIWKITAAQAGSYTLNTADKYVDRNIEVEIPEAAVGHSCNDASASINSVLVGLKRQTEYDLSGEGTITGTCVGNVTKPGWISELGNSTISGTASLSASIPAGTLKTTGGSASAAITSVQFGAKDSGNYPITATKAISGSFGAAVNTEGYVKDETASGSVSGNATVNASVAAIGLAASGTGSATIGSVSVSTKSGSNYPITGSASISGTATASVSSTGYGVKGVETGSGSVSGTASLSANLPAAAATVTLSGTASAPTIAASTSDDNISVGSITTSKPSSGYYAAVKATAPATTLSATKTVNTAGYLGSNTEITASGSTTAKTGSVYYLPVTSGSLSPSESGTDYTGWTEASVTVPSKGGLKIAEGYYPNTYILLDTMLDGKSDTAGTAAKDIRTGYIAYNVDGEKLTGTMGAATFGINTTTLPAGSATITAPAYNSSTGKFDISSSGTASGTITVTATSDPTGFIDKGTVAKSETISGSVSGSKALNKIAGSTSATASISGGELSKGSKGTSETWTDAAGTGSAVNSAPSSGVYIKVSRAKTTATATPNNVSITSEGYGTSANHGITAGSADTEELTAKDIFVPVKSGSASVTGGSISGSFSGPTLNSSTGKYDITYSASGSIGGSATAGWISSVSSGTVTSSGTKSLNAAALTHGNTATETKVSISASGTRSSNLAAPSASDTTYYVTVNASQSAAGSVTHSASVSEGYVPSAGLSQNATIPTSASITGNGTKVYLKGATATTSLSVTNATTVSSKTSGKSYVEITANNSGTTGTVYTGSAGAQNKYIEIYDGGYTVA